ncbi:MAG: cation:proton antiporter, partial [Candidatus Competibacteraceae bacterium]|nr:cation:proton antiporter [Candidatus Competibacteraceae bacterium]
MHEAQNALVFSLFLIFTGAAACATLALYARQALPIAYIVLGIAIGPYGFRWIDNAAAIEEMAQVGIMFLLFLLGLDLSPQRLLQMLRKATLI